VIKAIIFDCFDVLVTNGLPILKQKYAPNDPGKQGIVRALVQSLNEGKLDYQTFLLKLAELLGVSVPEIELTLDDNRPDEELFSYIQDKLDPHYKLGILSNAGDDWLEEMMGSERVKLFDVAILSYAVGYTKPHPEIYKLTATKLGVEPSECVFIDDKERFCDGAKAIGMQAILYKSFDQFKSELEKLLG